MDDSINFSGRLNKVQTAAGHASGPLLHECLHPQENAATVYQPTVYQLNHIHTIASYSHYRLHFITLSKSQVFFPGFLRLISL